MNSMDLPHQNDVRLDSDPGVAASAGRAPNRDSEGVPALLTNFKLAWLAENCDSLAALLAEEVVWVNVYGQIIQGRDSVTAYLASTLCPAFDPDLTIDEARSLVTVSARMLGDNVVIARLQSHEVKQAGRAKHVQLTVEKQSRQWQVIDVVVTEVRSG